VEYQQNEKIFKIFSRCKKKKYEKEEKTLNDTGFFTIVLIE